MSQPSPAPSRPEPPLVVGRLVALRALNVADVEASFAMQNDPRYTAVARSWPSAAAAHAHLKAILEQRVGAGWYSVAIDTLDGRHIGACHAFAFDAAMTACEAGILVFDDAYWGRGYGTEAFGLFIDHMKSRWPTLRNVRLRLLSENERAVRAFQKLGFRERARPSDPARSGALDVPGVVRLELER